MKRVKKSSLKLVKTQSTTQRLHYSRILQSPQTLPISVNYKKWSEQAYDVKDGSKYVEIILESILFKSIKFHKENKSTN